VRRLATFVTVGALLHATTASAADAPKTAAPPSSSTASSTAAGSSPATIDIAGASGTAGSDTPVLDTSPASQNGSVPFFPEAPPEAPPPLPRKKGLVLESRLGGMAYLGKFGNVAPTGAWLQTQLGWEFFKWLMVYGYGELALTGTSNTTPETTTTYFPIYGFGGGLRFTIPVTGRVAIFLQGNAGAMSAIVPRNTLTILGFQNAETLGFAVGGRVGVEWYQVDHHIALTLGVGLRDAFNFKIQDGESDVPLMLDAGLALRYTF
jgi:hypothetical protein